MTKQVNLVSSDLLPGYGPVQLPIFILIFCVSLVCAALWVFSAYDTRAQHLEEKAMWQQTAKNQLAALEAYQKLHPKLHNQDQLEQRNIVLTDELNLRRTTLQDLADQLENAIEGFTRPLLQLSDYDVQGLWLDTIQLKDGKRSFNLIGFAQTPELIPEYLAQLGQSDFKGITIQQLSVEKEVAQNQLWRFGLTNDKNLNALGVQ
ncbi:hypothetical protein [Reinekea sp.]|jgi:hypothetical protein|uniref:hypothetical protein n=1 Tax=Reinekea sp. TaxID=1970455 RepID=UPI003988DBF4